MQTVVILIHLMIVLAMVGLVLLQKSEGGGLGMGGGAGFMSTRGTTNALTRTTAILAAMFSQKKEVRESFVSQFDPNTSPTVVLGLSPGDGAPSVSLTRCLLDDRGEWKEGATTLKKKKEALDKIQEVLPISAHAAAVLLWGRLVRGWRGRTALRWTVAGFVMVLLANIGTAFVLEVLLRRG